MIDALTGLRMAAVMSPGEALWVVSCRDEHLAPRLLYPQAAATAAERRGS